MDSEIEKLRRMANPAHKMTEQLEESNSLLKDAVTAIENNQLALVKILAVIDGDKKNKDEKQSIRSLLESVNKTLKCHKQNSNDRHSWGQKVTTFALFLAVIGLGVEVATKGEIPVFTIIWHYAKGLFL